MFAGSLVAVVLLIAGCGDSAEPTQSTSYGLPASVKSLTVDGAVGKVDVTAEKGASAIRVVEKRTDNARPSHTDSGSTGALKYDCPDGFDVDTCRVDYEITMPDTVGIDIDNSAGEVTLDGALTRVDASTDAGKISGKGLGGGLVKASTKAGELNLGFTGAPRLVTTSATTGSTTITVPGSASYQVNADAEVGDTDVKVPNDPSAQNRIQAKTDVGEITIKSG
jgi:Putative adhesin